MDRAGRGTERRTSLQQPPTYSLQPPACEFLIRLFMPVDEGAIQTGGESTLGDWKDDYGTTQYTRLRSLLSNKERHSWHRL